MFEMLIILYKSDGTGIWGKVSQISGAGNVGSLLKGGEEGENGVWHEGGGGVGGVSGGVGGIGVVGGVVQDYQHTGASPRRFGSAQMQQQIAYSLLWSREGPYPVII